MYLTYLSEHFLFPFCLLYQAQVHRHAHKFREVQQCTLLSIKTGGCSEDCAYCPQSSRYKTEVAAQKLLSPDVVLEAAKKVEICECTDMVGTIIFNMVFYS
jgi:biotin synthase-like enzyme